MHVQSDVTELTELTRFSLLQTYLWASPLVIG